MRKKPPDWLGWVALWFLLLLIIIGGITNAFSYKDNNLDISGISFPNPLGVAEQRVEPSREEPIKENTQIRKVSWYDYKPDGINCDDPACITASGEPYNPEAFTTACWAEYSFGTLFRVCRLDGSRCVDVVCNDRGAFKSMERFLDLSRAAFRELWDLSEGISKARIEVL